MLVKVENNKIGSTYVGYLYYIYQGAYLNSYKNFEEFLFSALNQIIIFKETDFKHKGEIIFSISPKIKSEYETGKTSLLLKKYWEDYDKNMALIKNKISEDDLFSILYFFYITGNEVSFSDPGGYYSVLIKK